MERDTIQGSTYASIISRFSFHLSFFLFPTKPHIYSGRPRFASLAHLGFPAFGRPAQCALLCDDQADGESVMMV
jgi:hypothetical protein